MLEGGGRRRSALEGAFEEGKREHRPSGKEPAVAEKDEEHEDGKDSCSDSVFDKMADRAEKRVFVPLVMVKKRRTEGSKDDKSYQQESVFSFHQAGSVCGSLCCAGRRKLRT